MDMDASGAPSIAARFLVHVRKHALFPEPGTALAAVSGGPDSTALLDLMLAAARPLGLVVIAGHVDHGILPDSDAVAAGVAEVAERLGVECRVATLGLGAGASETVARRARYRALRAMQRETGARYLVTAHHADDQVETILLRTLRGSGVAGLAGIPQRGPDGLVRPLLGFGRTELSAWAERREGELGHRLVVHDDPSNRDPRHERSWIRAIVLPELERRYGKRVREHLLDVARDAGGNRRAWRRVLRQLPGLEMRRVAGGIEVARAPVVGYDDVLAVSVLRAVAREIGWTLGPRRAARALEFLRRGSSGRVFELGAGRVVELSFDRVRLVVHSGASRADPREVGVGAGSLEWDGWEFRWRAEVARTSVREGLVAWLVPGPWLVRGPAAGDRLVPLGGVGRRPVRRLLMEAQVPASERFRYPVIVRDGRVVWIPGVCRAAVAVPPLGVRALRIEARARGQGTASTSNVVEYGGEVKP